MRRILHVEDDSDLLNITAVHLTRAGYEVDAARSVAEMDSCLVKKTYDLILMDMLLPDGKGDALCRSIREKCHCPVIFISCLEDSDSIVEALQAGGDDYMVKPIKYAELLARVEANLRRAQSYSDRMTQSPDEQFIHMRNLTIDTQRRTIKMQDGTETELSTIEYTMLLYFMENRDKLLLYEELYNHVWQSDCLGDVRTVLVHISNLRKKIDPNKTGIIKTVRGAGYIFSDNIETA